MYRIPAIAIDVTLAFTNAAPLGPYRGAGRPEALYLIERLIDQAAAATGMDRVELRRRNLIPAAAMPYRTPNGPVYDSGEFETVMDRALVLADWPGFPQRRAASERAGRLRGIGLACFLEVAGGILDEVVELRFADDGTVALHTGAQPMGQGHLSTFPFLVAARLGIDASAVRLVQGDSDLVPAGTPSVASRSMMMAGSAAVDGLRGRHRQGAPRGGASLRGGRPRRRVRGRALPRQGHGPRDRPARAGGPGADLAERSARARRRPGQHRQVRLPPDELPERLPRHRGGDGSGYGRVAVVGYAAVDDVGRIVHETIVEGQIHGGIAQGLGQVLGEHVVYDEDGQLLTASFMDYLLPRADDLPALRVGHHGVPCTTNPLGVKGAGESGVAGALPSAVNAVLDALAGRGVRELDMPMSPRASGTRCAPPLLQQGHSLADLVLLIS